MNKIAVFALKSAMKKTTLEEWVAVDHFSVGLLTAVENKT